MVDKVMVKPPMSDLMSSKVPDCQTIELQFITALLILLDSIWSICKQEFEKNHHQIGTSRKLFELAVCSKLISNNLCK